MSDVPPSSPQPPRRWLRLLILSTATLSVVVFVLLWSVGANLPAEHQHRVGVTLKQGPSAVWAHLTAWERQAAWRTDVGTVELVEEVGGRPAWRLHPARGGTTEVAILALNAPHSFTLRVEGKGFAGTQSVRLVRDGLGTVVVLSERGEVQSPLRRLFWRRAGRDAPARRYLLDLAAALGEEDVVFAEPGELARLGP